MSIYKSETILDGRRLGTGGTEFRPCDRHGSRARYVRDGCVCGVVYRDDGDHRYVRVSPGYQIPAGARSRRDWNELVFGVEDDRAVMVRLDEDDGEVFLYRTDFEKDDIEGIARVIDESVNLMATLRPHVVEFVRDHLVYQE